MPALPALEARDPNRVRRRPADAAVVFVGEQPGDQEDLAGKPFVGPAGQMFDRALAEAGSTARAFTSPTRSSISNTSRAASAASTRLRTTPRSTIAAGGSKANSNLIRPQLTVALGATAARALTGRSVTISRERGRLMPFADGRTGLITVHPVLSAAPSRPGGAGQPNTGVSSRTAHRRPRTAGDLQPGRLSRSERRSRQSCGRFACLCMNTRPPAGSG